MGLDITAYETATRLESHDCIKTTPEDEDACWEKHLHVFAYKGFEQSLAGLEIINPDGKLGGSEIADCGYYEVDRSKSLRFRAGSYSGFGGFRSILCSVVLDVDVRELWATADNYRYEPFFELLNFADNEGCIGPIAARNLHEDFVANRSKVAASLAGEDAYFMEKYDLWTEACALAADTGLIDFH